MSALLTSPLNFVPTQPDYRFYVLRYRFSIGAHPSPDRLDAEAHKARYGFVEEMARQGWELADRYLPITGGPFPAVPLVTSVPNAPVRRPAVLGPHERFGPAYDSPVIERPTLAATDLWEYELSGTFVRKLMPTVATVDAISALEAKRKRARRRGR